MLFHSNPSQGNVLTGGQFFAVLRLVVHLDNGKPLDDSLAFIQGTSNVPRAINNVFVRGTISPLIAF
jgi:hypothetical protein